MQSLITCNIYKCIIYDSKILDKFIIKYLKILTNNNILLDDIGYDSYKLKDKVIIPLAKNKIFLHLSCIDIILKYIMLCISSCKIYYYYIKYSLKISIQIIN